MLQEIYDEMRTMGFVSNRSEFSRKWLGREESYYRGLSYKGREPSLEALMNCAIQLRAIAGYVNSHKRKKISRLANKCFDGVLQGKVGMVDENM